MDANSSLPNLQLETPATAASVRERELEVGRLVLRCVASRIPFVLQRAGRAVDALAPGPARRALRRAADGAAAGNESALCAGLLGYGAVLERYGLHDAAETVYRAVLTVRAEDAAVTLHAARAARKSGRSQEALALYRRAADQAAGDRRMVLLARVGEALVSARPLAGLAAVLVVARAERHAEVAAIVREERARLHATSHRTGAAVRDLAAAAAAYTDRLDRLRVLHRMAELLSARGDLEGAREALLAALDHADATQRGHTVQRLRTVARSQGDVLELRRSRGQGAGELVSLAPMPARRTAATITGAPTLAPRLRQVRSLLPAI